jgi:putative phage-type endonuclease
MLDWMGPILTTRQLWLKDRKNHIGASDCAAIMGVSPYTKAIDLYLDKVSDKINEESNYAMELGNTLEPIAREAYEKKTGKLFPAIRIIDEDRPFMSASLDGYNEEINHAIEIKYCGANFTDNCPDKYYPQIQFQYYISDAFKIYMVQINNSQDINTIEVTRDDVYIAEMLKNVEWFWDCVINKKEQEVREYSENIYITIENITYQISTINYKKALKLLKGIAYRLHKLHDGEFFSYVDFNLRYKVAKKTRAREDF